MVAFSNFSIQRRTALLVAVALYDCLEVRAGRRNRFLPGLAKRDAGIAECGDSGFGEVSERAHMPRCYGNSNPIAANVFVCVVTRRPLVRIASFFSPTAGCDPVLSAAL
jgi:hypothetical protein